MRPSRVAGPIRREDLTRCDWQATAEVVHLQLASEGRRFGCRLLGAVRFGAGERSTEHPTREPRPWARTSGATPASWTPSDQPVARRPGRLAA